MQVILTIPLLCLLSAPYIQSAAELPPACALPYIHVKASQKLIRAIQTSDITSAQEALKEGADINMYACNDTMQTTPLAYAVAKGNLAMVTFLLKHGAMVNLNYSRTTPPLLVACASNNVSRATIQAIITELLTHKADVNRANPSGVTPLMLAAGLLENESITRQLIFAGADINNADCLGQTALHLIQTDALKEVFLEARIINEQSFQELLKLEETMRAELLYNCNIPTEKLISAFDDAIPHYTNQGALQPNYDLLNARIAEQWLRIKNKLEVTRLLNQPECLPVQSVAAITAAYLFSEQR